MKELKKKWPFSGVVITGGSSGIGEAFIRYIYTLHEETAFCNLSRTAPEIKLPNIKILHNEVDLSNLKVLDSQVESALVSFDNQLSKGPILLINNSGFGAYGRFPNPGIIHHTEMLAVNVIAPTILTAHALPLLKKRGGAIINVASIAGFQPTPYLSAYGASKSFILNWSLALREELKKNQISCLTLCPGPTKTNFFAKAGFREPPLEKSRGPSAKEVVEAAIKGLIKNKALVVPGWRNKLTVTTTGLLPKTLCSQITEKILGKLRLEQFLKNE